MKMIQQDSAGKFSRLLFIAAFSMVLAACGGSSTTDEGDVSNPDGIDANGDGETDSLDDYDGDGFVTATDSSLFLVNPDMQDVNGDLLANLADDINGDGIVNQADFDDFDAQNQGNIDPDCITDVCDGNSDLWSDFAQIQQNRSPISSYALGIQRILFCTGYGGTGDMDSFADGIFGPGTAAAVETFQTDEAITSDGIVGDDTWNALQSQLDGPFELADSDLQSWTVQSTNAECQDIDQFYSDSTGQFTIEACPGDGILESSPFTVNEGDLPNCS